MTTKKGGIPVIICVGEHGAARVGQVHEASMGDKRVSDARLRHLAQHWPSEMRVVCHELIAAREELLALRAREERLRAVVETARRRRALIDALNDVDDEMADALAALDSEEARR